MLPTAGMRNWGGARAGGSGPLHIVTIYDPVVQIQAIFTNGVLEGVQTGVTTALSGVSPNEASLGRSLGMPMVIRT